MKKIKISLVIFLFAISFTSFAQSKVAHINTTELVASMPEMNDAKAELEKLAKTYETDIHDIITLLRDACTFVVEFFCWHGVYFLVRNSVLFK